ncbi:MAG: hypothetical protein ACPGJU_10655 [Coraliomargarita sp.]
MKKIALLTIAAAVSTAHLGAQDFIAGFDFTNTTGAQDVGDFAADVAGSQSGVSIDTSAFIQGSDFGGDALAFEGRQVGFDTVGNAPLLGDFDGQNGFSSDPFGMFFQGTINSLSFTIDIDTSAFNSITFSYDSFSDDTGVHTGGEWFTNADGGGNVSLDVVTFGGAYSDESYLIDTTGVDSLSLTFTFASTEADTFGADVTGQRVHFDNFAIGGTAVPEPSAFAAISGLMALLYVGNRRRR